MVVVVVVVVVNKDSKLSSLCIVVSSNHKPLTNNYLFSGGNWRAAATMASVIQQEIHIVCVSTEIGC